MAHRPTEVLIHEVLKKKSPSSHMARGGGWGRCRVLLVPLELLRLLDVALLAVAFIPHHVGRAHTDALMRADEVGQLHAALFRVHFFEYPVRDTANAHTGRVAEGVHGLPYIDVLHR